jgi:Fe-S-cluster containining protein
MEPDPLRELERQVEAAGLFSHALLAQSANRADENEAIIRGLVEVLVAREIVGAEELVAAVNAVRTETDIGVAIRVDNANGERVNNPVDCGARMHLCHAVCCRLRFPLTVEEVEDGPLKWDLGRPYFNRHGPDGYCHQCAPDTHACQVYEQRPAPCRQYTCEGDERIWKDFDAMEINQEWIDEHLGTGPGPVEVFMTAVQADSRPAA